MFRKNNKMKKKLDFTQATHRTTLYVGMGEWMCCMKFNINSETSTFCRFNFSITWFYFVSIKNLPSANVKLIYIYMFPAVWFALVVGWLELSWYGELPWHTIASTPVFLLRMRIVMASSRIDWLIVGWSFLLGGIQIVFSFLGKWKVNINNNEKCKGVWLLEELYSLSYSEAKYIGCTSGYDAIMYLHASLQCLI